MKNKLNRTQLRRLILQEIKGSVVNSNKQVLNESLLAGLTVLGLGALITIFAATQSGTEEIAGSYDNLSGNIPGNRSGLSSNVNDYSESEKVGLKNIGEKINQGVSAQEAVAQELAANAELAKKVSQPASAYDNSPSDDFDYGDQKYGADDGYGNMFPEPNYGDDDYSGPDYTGEDINEVFINKLIEKLTRKQ
jgi:hypothetical protein